jgi:hypothetical protein
MRSPLRESLPAVRRRLGASLFPESAPSWASLNRYEAATLVAAFVFIAVFLQLLRIGFTASLDSLWAEDGVVFVQGALSQSFFHSLTTEYAGYIVLFPRLAGEAATLLPLRDAPAAISILAALAVALSGIAVWFAAAGHIRNPWLRGTLAALTVLAPVGGLETIDSVAYASWYMLFACFWVLLWRPRTMTGACLGAALVALTALSNPGIWFFLPLAALRALCARDRRDATIAGAYFLSAGLQALALAVSDYEAIEPVWTAHIWTVLLQRVLDGAALGLRLGGVAWEHLGWFLLIALLVLGAASLAIGWWRAGWGSRGLAVIALPTAVGMFVISVYQRAVGDPMLWPAHLYFGNAGRYSIVPALLLISVAFVFLDDFESRRGRPRRISLLSGAAIALMAVSAAVSFPAGESAIRGTPTWDEAVERASATCAHGGSAVAQLPTAPPGFELQLPCSAIPGAGGGTRR